MNAGEGEAQEWVLSSNNGCLDTDMGGESFNGIAASVERTVLTNDLCHTSGRPLDERFLRTCHIYHHDPRRPLPTTKDILMRLDDFLANGITKTDLRLLLRKCKSCRRFMYADSRAYHRCDSAQLIGVDDISFDFLSAFLSSNEHCGWMQSDLFSLLGVCNRCERVVLHKHFTFHACP